MSALSPEAIELAQLLTAEVTARLEHLSAKAAELQKSIETAPDLAVRLAEIMKLMEAREVVVGSD